MKLPVACVNGRTLYGQGEELRLRARHLCLALCIVGTLLPYTQCGPFLLEHGLALRLFIEEAFATRIAGFFTLGVLVSAAVLGVLAFVRGRRIGMRLLWAPLAATLIVGVPVGLPLFLYLRDLRLVDPERGRPRDAV